MPVAASSLSCGPFELAEQFLPSHRAWSCIRCGVGAAVSALDCAQLVLTDRLLPGHPWPGGQ